jgi:hypothetical protein
MLRAVTGPGSDGIERRLAAILSVDAVGVCQQNPSAEPDFLARWLDGLRKAELPEE